MALPQVGLDAVISNLPKFEQGTKTITQAYEGINAKADAVGKATERMGLKFDEASGRWRTAAGQFATNAEVAAAGINKAKSAADNTGKSFIDLGSIASRAGGQLVGLGGTLLNIGAIAGGAALAGVTALGAGLATFAVTGISKAIDLDAQMATIAATMNTTKDAVGPLKDLILDLALDPNLTVNTTQAADAIQLLAQNGATADDIMNGLAKSTVALANATGAQFNVAADVASGVMSVFGLKANEVETAIDGITGVTNQSKFTIDDYAQAFAQAGGIAAGMGVTLEDFNTVIGITATSFKSGSDAGTSFKTFLQRLANPTAKMKAVMEELGITLFDSNGNMRDMKDVAGQLQTAFKGLTEAERAEAAAKLGGADAARTVIALSQISSTEFDNLSGSINESGQAFRAAATRVDSVKGAFEIFRGIVEAVQIQVGDKFLPLLRNITVGFTDLATKSAPMVVAFFGSISELISGLIVSVTGLFDVFGEKGLAGVFASLGFGGSALFLKKLGELAVMMGLTGTNAASLGETITTILGGAFTWLTTNLFPMLTQAIEFIMLHFEEFKGALIGIGVVLGAGIFAALIAGIVGLISPIMLVIGAAALLGAAWAGNWGGIQEKTFAVWAVVQPVLMQLGEWLSVNIPIALQSLADAWNNVLLPAVTTFVSFLTGTWIPLQIQWFDYLINLATNALVPLAAAWTNILLPAITGVSTFIKTSLLPLWVSVINFFGAVGKKGLEAWAGLWKNILLPALAAVWDYVSVNILPIFTQVGDVIETKTKPAIEGFTGILPDFTAGMEIVNKLIKDAIGFFQGLTTVVNSFQLPAALQPGSPPPMALALRDVASAANAAGAAMGNFSQATLDSLLGVQRNMASVNNAIGTARDTVEDFLETVIEDNKAKRALTIMGRIFRDNSEAILGATDRAAKFRELLEGINFGVNSQQQGAIMGAAGIWLESFDKALAQLKASQRQIFINAGKMALTIGNKLNDFVEGSIDILNDRVKTLEEFIASGQDVMRFNGDLVNQVHAQKLLNEALAEQREIQDDILILKQNEQKLTFLEKQLSLVETLNEAGLDVQAILGGISLGLDASIPDMIAATNRLVMAMIEQVNRDLQMGSPSKVMMQKGEQTGQGFVEGLMASIPGITGAMKKAIFGPSLVSGPAISGGSNSRVVNNNFNMNVNSGASPQGVMQQFEIARAMA